MNMVLAADGGRRTEAAGSSQVAMILAGE